MYLGTQKLDLIMRCGNPTCAESPVWWFLSIDLSLELGTTYAYIPATSTSLATLRGSGLEEKPRLKMCLGSGWMHVVVSSSRVVFQHNITSFVIVCFGFLVVRGVSLHYFLTDPLFLLYSMHFIPLLILLLFLSCSF